MPGSIFSFRRRTSSTSDHASLSRSNFSRAVPEGLSLIDPAPKIVGGQGIIEILPDKIMVILDMVVMPANTSSTVARIEHPTFAKFGATIKASQFLIPLIKLTNVRIEDAMVAIRRNDGVWFRICTNVFNDDWLISADSIHPFGLDSREGSYSFEILDHNLLSKPELPPRGHRYEL